MSYSNAFNISKMFSYFIGSENSILNVAIFNYSMHKFRERIIRRKYQLI